MSHSQSDSKSSSSTSTISDSYNRTLNYAQNWSDVGNSSFSFTLGTPSGAPEIASMLPVAVGLALIGLILFRR